MSELPLSLKDRILHTRGGGAVKRAHCLRYNGTYSNAEHQWGVAMLIWHLFRADFQTLVVFALTHDVAECLVGDIPSTAKDSASIHPLEEAINEEFDLPSMTMMTRREHFILKLCDRLELYIWAKEQYAQGNRYAREIIANLERILSNQESYTYSAGYANAGLRPASIQFTQVGDEFFEQAWDFYQSLHLDHAVVPERSNLLQAIKERHGF